jgi:LacI family transcriptional regulator
MSTMRDVAHRAGVSAKTVSRVMNNDRYVSDDVRARVLRAVEELQYVPNAMARSFRTGQDTAIGIAVPTLNLFFGQVVEAVERVARERGVAVNVSCLGNIPDNEQLTLETLLSRQLVGLIAAPIAPDQSYLKPWRNNTAMVFIDRRPRKLAGASVVFNNFSGASTAILHLIGHGHRRIAFAGDALSVPTTARRRHGYETALFDSGVAVDPFLVSFEADTSPVVPRLLALADPPTAIFSASAACSIQIVRQLHAADRTDITVVGFGDFPLADVVSPPVTVVDQDAGALGTMAADRLFERIDSPEKRLPRHTVIPVKLIRRGCCQHAKATSAA